MAVGGIGGMVEIEAIEAVSVVVLAALLWMNVWMLVILSRT